MADPVAEAVVRSVAYGVNGGLMVLMRHLAATGVVSASALPADLRGHYAALDPDQQASPAGQALAFLIAGLDPRPAH